MTAETINKGTIRVFMLDDDVSLAQEIHRLLENSGYEVAYAYNLRDAKDHWRKFNPDICLLDLKLPDGSGLEFLDIIASEDPGISVLMLSGYGSIAAAVQAIRHGAEDFITKPIEPDHFLFRLDKLIEDRQRRADLEKANSDLEKSRIHLMQSHKMVTIGKITAGIAHEINSPIGVIRSNADVADRCVKLLGKMLDGEGDSHSREEYRKVVDTLEKNNKISVEASDRIANLVRTLKGFTRLDEAEFDQVDIEQGLSDTLTIIQHEIKEGTDIECEFGRVPKTWCYLSELNQVFMVILRNALQAIEKKGKVVISTSCRDQYISVKIRDTGVGMPPEKLKTLFDPGFEVKDSRVGMCLGLVSAHNIIQKHRGELEVESEVGVGTTFTITLPRDLKQDLLGS